MDELEEILLKNDFLFFHSISEFNAWLFVSERRIEGW